MSMTISLEEFPGTLRKDHCRSKRKSSRSPVRHGAQNAKFASSGADAARDEPLSSQRNGEGVGVKRGQSGGDSVSGFVAGDAKRDEDALVAAGDAQGEEVEVRVEVEVEEDRGEWEETGGEAAREKVEEKEEVSAALKLLSKSQRDYAPLVYTRTEYDAEEIDLNAPWSSSHRFYCFGLCVRGPKSDMLPVDLFVVVCVTFAVFVILVGGIGFGLLHTGIWLVSVIVLWIATGWAAFVITSLTEPGVIIGQSKAKLLEQLQDMDVPPAEIGSSQEIKICKECNLVSRQDQYVMHCYECNACVEDLDHHCGVTGTCIGARNKVHFFMMLYFISGAWTYIAVGLLMLVLEFTVATDASSTADVTLANVVLAVFSAVHWLIYMLFWAAAYFDWIRVVSCCGGFIPNPFYTCHKRLCFQRYRRRQHSKWVTTVPRTALCCALPCFMAPTRNMYKRSQPVPTGELTATA